MAFNETFFRGIDKFDDLIVDGSFDINIWYSYDDDKKTAVASKSISYSETANVKTKNGTSLEGSDIIVRALKQPNCIKVDIDGDKIKYTIEDNGISSIK